MEHVQVISGGKNDPKNVKACDIIALSKFNGVNPRSCYIAKLFKETR
jgi:hypothetical protein